MLDRDLAEMYGVPTFRLNEAVKRNISRFPDDFMFRLTKDENVSLRSQFAILEKGKHSKYLPYAFTEHGVTMLASVLKSPVARKMNIAIVKAFIAMRKMVIQYSEVIKVIDDLKERIDGHDAQLNQIYDALKNMLDKKIKNLLANIKPDNKLQKVGLPDGDGLIFINLSEIIRCDSDGNYTFFILTSGKKIIASRTLGEYEQLFAEDNFFRVHRSHLINLQHVKKYIKGEGGYVVMSDNSQVEVSRRNKTDFLERLSHL